MSDDDVLRDGDTTIERTHLAKYQPLGTIGLAMISRASREEVLKTIVGALRHMLNSELVWLMWLDNEMEKLTFAKTPLPEALVKIADSTVPVDGSFAGYVVREKESRQEDGVWLKAHHYFDTDPTLIPFPMTRSLIGAPIIVQNSVVGVLQATDHGRHRPFTAEDLNILSIAAILAAIAEEKVHRYDSLREIAETVASTLDLDAVLEKIMEILRRMLRAKKGSLILFDEEQQVLKIVKTLVLEELDKIKDISIPLDSSIAGKVFQTREPSLKYDARPEPGHFKDVDKALGSDTCSLICAPLVVHNRAIGVLQVIDDQPGRFEKEDLDLLQHVASSVAVAVQNAQMYKELRKIAEATSSTLDLERVYEEVMNGLRRILKAEVGSLALLDEEAGNLRFVATLVPEHLETMKGKPLELGQGIAGHVAIHGKPELVPDAWEDERHNKEIDKALGKRTYALMCAPLKVRGQVIGVLQVLNYRKEDKFSKADLDLLVSVAGAVAVAVDNARYHAQLLKEQQTQAKAELRAAQGDIAGNMVHRINNKVGAIRQFIMQIQRRQKKVEEEQEGQDSFFKFLREKNARILENAEDTLRMAQKIKEPFEFKAEREPIEVNSLLRGVLDDIPIQKGIEVHRQLETKLPKVLATQQLGEVFRILIVNALEAMRSRGSLTVVSEQAGERIVSVSVIDTGPGISPKIQDDLFRLGTTTKEKEGGLGYGLWWSKIYLETIDGAIELDSKLGPGCKFTVKLPSVQKVP